MKTAVFLCVCRKSTLSPHNLITGSLAVVVEMSRLVVADEDLNGFL